MKSITTMVGERIRFFRKSRGITIVELAGRMNISKSAISKYERGESAITLDILSEIAKALQIDPIQLLDESYLPSEGSIFRNSDISENSYNKYFVYTFLGHDKAYYSKNVLFIGNSTAKFYAEVENETEYWNCKYYYAGNVFNDTAKKRIVLINPLNELDIIITEIENPLGNTEKQYSFFASFSVGVHYPIAGRWLISRKIINSTSELGRLLPLTNDDLRSFKAKGAFFVHDKNIQ